MRNEHTGHKPSLLHGSAQLVGITKFKIDPNDPTISLSILIVKALNADFDGDALNISFAVDNKMADLWLNLAPHRNVFVLNTPNEISNNISIPKTVIASITNWISSERIDNDTPDQLKRFYALPGI